ncbi:MAG: hypothetical protein PHG47_05755 [Sulfuricella sp.]|nr:hypothetical protein [Sulfuricella sp.]
MPIRRLFETTVPIMYEIVQKQRRYWVNSISVLTSFPCAAVLFD